jgi:hypothetical protein
MKNLIHFQNFSKNVAEVRMEICHQSEAYTLVKLFFVSPTKKCGVFSQILLMISKSLPQYFIMKTRD